MHLSARKKWEKCLQLNNTDTKSKMNVPSLVYKKKDNLQIISPGSCLKEKSNCHCCHGI